MKSSTALGSSKALSRGLAQSWEEVPLDAAEKDGVPQLGLRCCDLGRDMSPWHVIVTYGFEPVVHGFPKSP